MDKEPTATKRRFLEALALYKQGKLNPARTVCEEILATEPDQGQTQQLLGLISINESSLNNAIYHFQRSLTTLKHSAICHQNLASAYNLAGQKDKAVEHYREALKINPDYVEAYFNLVYIIQLENEAALIENIERLLKKKNLSRHHRTLLHFAAAKYYNSKNLFDRAFHHVETTNKNHISSYFSGKEAEQTKATIKTFSSELFKKYRVAGNKSQGLVFLIGMPSAGETLLNSMLKLHSKIGTVNNNTDFLVLAHKLDELKPGDFPYPQCVSHLANKVINSCSQIYLKHLDTQKVKPWVTNSFCLNFRYAGLIKLLFPNAKFIEVRRHPQDVCLEAYLSIMQPHCNFSDSLGGLIDCYQNYLELMEHWKTLFPEDILSIKFERLVRSPMETLQQALSFLGLSWEKDCIIKTSPGFGYNFEIGFSKYYSDFLGELRPKLKTLNKAYKESS